MVTRINPKVNVVDYGPYMDLGDGNVVTPDEFVYGASQITYKDVGALQELIENKKEGKDVREQMIKSVIKSAGAGHASMPTTPVMWVFLEGECSKMVDSLFTGVRYGSSLMPSGRRVPIDTEAIVIPQDFPISQENVAVPDAFHGDAEKLYLQVSRENIKAYEILQQRGVSTQEASKIVQYGHKGGGFMLMSLETLANLSRDFKDNPYIPKEGKEIIKQLEDFVHSHGMEVTYESRKAAPRTGCPNPGIFHKRNNFPHSLAKKYHLDGPSLVGEVIFEDTLELEERVNAYLKMRKEVFSSPENVAKGWKALLKEEDEIIADYNDSLRACTYINQPWRVWGETKRHRTMLQTAESVYHGRDRMSAFLFQSKEKELTLDYVKQFFSVPESVAKDPENMRLWKERIVESNNAFEMLLRMGVKESDAIQITPRGMKFGVTKNKDFYNITLGHDSLRLCSTAEPEMREITEQEANLVKNKLPDYMRELIGPKCMNVGFCPDKNCGKVNQYLGFQYTKEFHGEIQDIRRNEIMGKISGTSEF
jgi:hypothetical protein